MNLFISSLQAIKRTEIVIILPILWHAVHLTKMGDEGGQCHLQYPMTLALRTLQKMYDIYKNCGNMVCIGAEIIFTQSSFTAHYDVGLGTCGSDQTAATGMETEDSERVTGVAAWNVHFQFRCSRSTNTW